MSESASLPKASSFSSFLILFRLALKSQGKGWRNVVAAFLILLPILASVLARFNVPNPSFALEMAFAKEFNGGKISEEIFTVFKKRNIPLLKNGNISVTKRDEQWEIVDADQDRWVIKKEGNQVHVYPAGIPPLGWYIYLINNLFLQYFIWMIPLLYGVESFRDEVEKGTIHYIWIRPVPRYHLVLAKFFSTLVWALPALLLSQMVCFWIYNLQDYTVLLKIMGVTVLGGFYFSAFFLLLGILFAKPLPYGIIYGFFFEVMVASLDDSPASRITILHYLYNLVNPLGPNPDPEIIKKIPAPLHSVLLIFSLGLCALFLACWAVSRIEILRNKKL